jgi:hypothetical protein
MQSNYQQAKQQLKSIAAIAKINHPKDKPAIRLEISSCIDNIASNHNLTEYQRNLLHNYACVLHPKD